MKKICVLWLMCLVCLAGGGGCASETAAYPSPNPAQPTALSSPAAPPLTVSALIEQVRQSPQDYLGEQVEITGYFHGWDLLDEVGSPPPVTRSDWVIADEGGALYVTGLLPTSLDPASRDDLGALLRLTARVAMAEEQVYLEGLSLAVLAEP